MIEGKVPWDEFHAAVLLAFPNFLSQGTLRDSEGMHYYFTVPYTPGDMQAIKFDEIRLLYNLRGSRSIHHSSARLTCKVFLHQFDIPLSAFATDLT